jgi:hypothetical protein
MFTEILPAGVFCLAGPAPIRCQLIFVLAAGDVNGGSKVHFGFAFLFYGIRTVLPQEFAAGGGWCDHERPS